jgi:hypothetical protein
MTSEDKIERGLEATQLLAQPLLIETLDALEKHAIERLAAADVNDTKTLQTLAMSLQAARGFKAALQGVAREGAHTLEAEAKKTSIAQKIRAIGRFGA